MPSRQALDSVENRYWQFNPNRGPRWRRSGALASATLTRTPHPRPPRPGFHRPRNRVEHTALNVTNATEQGHSLANSRQTERSWLIHGVLNPKTHSVVFHAES